MMYDIQGVTVQCSAVHPSEHLFMCIRLQETQIADIISSVFSFCTRAVR